MREEALARVESEEGIERELKTDRPSTAQIARVTGVLATHILDAARQQARDPAEHQLDEHRLRFGESDSRHISIRCDRCGLRSRGAGTVARASANATEDGWFVSEEVDHCPVCRDGSKLLGSGEGDAAPDTLSGPDLLLVQRLTWVLGQIALSVQPRALIRNASASGHRTMLSDLARRFAYDDGFLMEAVLKIAASHPGVIPSAFTDEGGDLSWLEELFTLLAAEDVPEKERG